MTDGRKANFWNDSPVFAVYRIQACKAKKDAAAAALANAEAEYQAWIDSAPPEFRELVDELMRIIVSEGSASAAVRGKLDEIGHRIVVR